MNALAAGENNDKSRPTCTRSSTAAALSMSDQAKALRVQCTSSELFTGKYLWHLVRDGGNCVALWHLALRHVFGMKNACQVLCLVLGGWCFHTGGVPISCVNENDTKWLVPLFRFSALVIGQTYFSL